MCGIFTLLNNRNTCDESLIMDAFNKGDPRGPEESRINFNGDRYVTHMPIPDTRLIELMYKMKVDMEIFKDDNNWNEKSIIGFIAFLLMCVILLY